MNSESLTDPLRETLAIFERAGEPRTTPEVADHLDLGRRSTYARLERLVEAGRLETKKAGANARVWWRPLPRSDPLANDGRLQDSTVDGLEGCIDNGSDAGADGSDAGADGSDSGVDGQDAGADGSDAGTDGSDSGADGHDADTGPTRHGRGRREPGHEFERLVDAVDEYAIFTLDADGSVRTWNPGVERIKGYTEDEIVGEHVSIFYTEEDRVDGVPQRNLDEATHHGSVETEGWRVRADGSLFWANVTISAIRDDDGSLGGYAKVTRDMTERREYERRLESQAERLEYQLEDLESELDEVFDRISDGFYALDERFRFRYLNDQAQATLRLDETAVGADIRDVAVLADSFEDALYEATETQESVTLEVYDDPVEAWFHTAVYPSESGLSVYFQDITERKEREQALRESEHRYETLTENFPNGAVTLVDESLRYVTFGGTPVGDTNLTGVDLEGEALDDVLPAELADVVIPQYEAALDGETARFVETVGDQFCQFHFVPVRDDSGAVFAAMAISQDITEQKKHERALRDAKAQLEAATEAGSVGTWEWHLPEDRIVTGRWFARLFGIDPEAAREGVTPDKFVSAIHDDDRDRVEAAIEAQRDRLASRACEAREQYAAGQCTTGTLREMMEDIERV